LEFAARDDDKLDAIGAVAKRLPRQPRFARVGGANGRADAEPDYNSRQTRGGPRKTTS
jgi:hypothetical protein